MDTSLSRRASRVRTGAYSDWRALAGAALVVAVATGAGALLAQVLMAPSRGDLGQLSLYLAGSGILTLALGGFALRLADQAFGLNLRAKSFISAAVGTGIALLNVFIVAQLMFLSTDHDLPVLMALLLFAAVITLLLAQWVSGAVASGLRSLAQGAQRLANGDYSARVPVTSRDEVGDLTAVFNEMAERLEEAESLRASLDQERRQLIIAISHDLRTPLASLQAMIEALNDQVVADPDEIRRYYQAMMRELQRLGSLINDLFELAQIDSGALRLQREKVALGEIAMEAVDAMQPRAHRQRLDLTLSVEGHIPPLSLDKACMSRVLLNLLENAVNNTPAGGRIHVSLGRTGSEAVLKVLDSGTGIAAEDLPHIWTPFYRGEKSRKRLADSSGTGLGLAIVKGLVEAHGGTVAASSEPGHGTEVTVALPRS